MSQLHRRVRPTGRGKKVVVTDGALLRVFSGRIRRPLVTQPFSSTERIVLSSRVPDGVMTTGVVPEKSTPIMVSRTDTVGVIAVPAAFCALIEI